MNKLGRLIENYQGGDSNCLEEIIDILNPSLNYIKKKFKDIEIYDEVFCSIPNIVLKIKVNTISEFDYGYTFNYLRKSIINKSFDIARRLKREKELICYNSDILDVKINDSNQSYLMDSDLEFFDLIKNLSEREKFIIKRFFKEQVSIIEISEELNISRQGVNKIKNKALYKLKKELEYC